MALVGFRQAASRFDCVIISLLLAASALGIWWSLRGSTGSELIVEQDGAVMYVAPLSDDAQINISGELGPMLIKVAKGKASVVDATCPQRVCMAMGEIHRQGEIIACVPNKVLLRIRGEEQGKAYDLLTQ